MENESTKCLSYDKIDISCTWGDGPDVCVNIHYDPKKLYHWAKGFFPLDLTGEEAIEIGHKLIQAGVRAQELDRCYKDHMESEVDKAKGDKA